MQITEDRTHVVARRVAGYVDSPAGSPEIPKFSEYEIAVAPTQAGPRCDH